MAEKKNKGSFLKMLFGNRNKVVDNMMEEQVTSPGRMIVNNFLHNKLGMTGLIIFLLIFLTVFIAPQFIHLDLGYSDATQTNIPPTMGMLNVPKELASNVQDISAGTTFGVGCDKNGKVYIWGYTKITDVIDLAEIPDEVKEANIVKVAAGYDHVVAVDDEGSVYVWGSDRLGQGRLPSDLTAVKKSAAKTMNVVQLEAGNQFSVVLDDQGEAYFWGNANMADIDVKRDYQGNIKKVAVATYNYCLLLNDGSVVYGGLQKNNAFTNIPEELSSGVVDIAASGDTMAAVKEDGSIVVWGNTTHGELDIPETTESKPVEIYGGRYHYTVLLENGEVVCWGANNHGQLEVPAAAGDEDIATVFAGFYQNYAVTEDGELLTWGLKGHLMGTDELGRDVFTRLIHGGKTTMTVGAVSVIIALIIGVITGGLAGYFGGKVDMVVMRVSEVIGALPFLPFALLLSAIIGSSVSITIRMYLIMLVLGLLSWTGICRLVRAQILAEREKEFVVAAKAMGVKEGSIIFKHILPNVLSVLMVQATLSFATCMLTESSLSYLGFGISPPTPTWGNMLTGANNSVVIQQYWWRWVFPASIFGICTICINLIGDSLRDAMDPKSSGR